MPDIPASTLPADLAGGEDFSLTLLEISLTGFILFRPVYDAAGGAVTDLAYEYLNPAAQQTLRLPQRPAESFLTRFPSAGPAGIFAFYRDAFLSGQTQREAFDFQHDGLDGYFHLVARRQGPLLLVSFLDTHDPLPAAQAGALQQAQARERAARAEAEHQRGELERVFEQAPVAIAVYRGPRYVIELANSMACRLWGRTPEQVLGKGLFEALPEVAGMGYEELLDGVMATGVPHVAQAMEAQHDRNDRRETVYWDFVYVPMYEADGSIYGAMVVATEATEQVRARQQMQQLNNELEARVAARTAETRAALAGVEQQREQLRVQQGLLSQIIGQVPAAIATFSGPEHRYSFFNDQYQSLVSGRAERGRPVAEVLSEIREQGFLALLDQVYATGRPFSGTETMLLLPGPAAGAAETRYIDFIYQPLFDGQDHPQGILAFTADVTERVRARKQADTMQAAMLAVVQRQAQQRQDLLQVFEQTPVSIVLLREPDHRIDYFNPAFVGLFPPEEWPGPLHGHTLAEVYPRIKLAGLVELMDKVFATGESQAVIDMPLEKLHPGSPRYVTLAYQAHREEGCIVGVAAFVYDVTEQVLTRRANEAQQAELQRIFERAPVAISVYRMPGYVLEFGNTSLARIMGSTPDEMLGRPLVDFLPDMQQQGLQLALDEVCRTGEPFVAQELPLTVVRHHGQDLGYFNFVYELLPAVPGRESAVICVATEVTDQVLARQQVQTLNEKLAAINQEMQATNEELYNTNARLTRTNADLDTFVYSASHDLKSPITNVEGLLLALREHLPAPTLEIPLVPRLLDMMDRAVARFQQTLMHLTDVSRLQQALPEHPAEAIDLPALVEAVRLDILPELTAAGATLTVDLAACPTVRFSAKNLRSVVYNLLSNAVKYRAPDRAPDVQLRCHAAPGQVVLAVQDNGLGLSTAQQGELFRMFRRLHAHVPGSGVGLYMVKKMVENAGGSITVHSQPGVGSTFTVTLPNAD